MESRSSVIRSLAPLGADHYWLEVESLFGSVAPGQFFQVRIDASLFLRRPFSVARIGAETLGILFKVAGSGTAILARKKPGEPLDMIGPLGNGFPVEDVGPAVWLAAGGTGVAPLLAAAARLCADGRAIRFFYGGRTAGHLFPALLPDDDFPLTLCTDDGSRGRRGTTVEAVAEALAGGVRPDAIFADGPPAMVRGIAAAAAAARVPCWVSLENRMACGMGLCFGCVVKIRDGGVEKNLRTCREGPVFRASDVVWE